MEVDVHYRSSSRASVSSGRMTIPSSNVSDWDDFDDSETRAGVNALKTAQQLVPAVDKKMSSMTTSHSSSAATAPIYLQQRRLPIHLRQRYGLRITVRLIFAILAFNLHCSHLSSAAVRDYSLANTAPIHLQPLLRVASGRLLEIKRHSACNVPPGIRMSRLLIRRRGSRQGSRPSSQHTLSRSETLLGLSPNLYESDRTL
ncbi:hypothetical protein K438DRAFT_376173 [Mycena galopus ATCC 62051]|nr:hypothetical protein K438DRAFT_376173 [Mycena galopus ATCC 62051]